MMAMATELSAPGKRAQTAAIMFCGMPIGGGFSALVTQVLPPDMGWRALFVVGGVLPMLLVPALWLYMSETLRPGEHKSEKRHSTWHVLFGEGRAKPSLLLWSSIPADCADPVSDLELAADAGSGEGIRSLGRAAVRDGFQLRRRRRRDAVRATGRQVRHAHAAGGCVHRTHRDVDGARGRDESGDDSVPERRVGILPARCELRVVRSRGLVLPVGDARYRFRRERRGESRRVDPRADAGRRDARRRGDSHECRSVHGAYSQLWPALRS